MAKVAGASPKRNVRVLEDHKEKMSNPRSDSYLSSKLEALRDAALALAEEVKAAETLKVCDPQNGINLQHGINLNEEMNRYETYLIMIALDRAGGIQRRAARLLGIRETTLNSKIKRYQIAPRKSHHEAPALAAVIKQ